ncbi:hypothetical protein Hanom_Chr09g00763131 [Helianthus anomalus]
MTTQVTLHLLTNTHNTLLVTRLTELYKVLGRSCNLLHTTPPVVYHQKQTTVTTSVGYQNSKAAFKKTDW